MVRGIPGANGIALVVVDFGRVRGQGVAAAAVVALAQDSDLIVVLCALGDAHAQRLEGGCGVALDIGHGGIASQLGVGRTGGAREGWQREGESREDVVWVHVGGWRIKKEQCEWAQIEAGVACDFCFCFFFLSGCVGIKVRWTNWELEGGWRLAWTRNVAERTDEREKINERCSKPNNPTRSVSWQFEYCKHKRDKKGSKRFHLKSCNAGLTDPFVWPPGTVGDPLFYGDGHDRASNASKDEMANPRDRL